MGKRWGRRVGLGLLALLLAATSVLAMPGRAGAFVSCNDPDPVTQTYRRFTCIFYNVSLHSPSAEEVDFWTQFALDHGRAALIDSLYNSDEATANFVAGDLYSDFLGGRTPDPGGLAYFMGLLRSGGKSLEAASEIAASSDEAFGIAGGTNAGWVDYLYDNVLDRSADTGGHDYWTALLDGGVVSRAAVARAFITGDEATTVFVGDDLYNSYLFRDPDSADAAAFWAGRVQAVGQRATIIEFLNVDDVFITYGND